MQMQIDEQDAVTVKVADLHKQCASKADLMEHMSKQSKLPLSLSVTLSICLVGLLLPHRRSCTFEFLIQVLTGEKKAFKKEEVEIV